MAEEKEVPELDPNEAQELERLLDEDEQAAQDAAKNAPFWKKPFVGLKGKKKWMILGGLSFVLLAALGGGAYFLLFQPVEESVVEEPEVPGDLAEDEAQEPEAETVAIEAPNVYPLKSFFVPLTQEGRETGKFINLKVHLLLSNQKLDKDIDKIRPLIRQNIYEILKRRNLKDLKKSPNNLEESLKREIITASNSLLLSGTGTITDVYFSEFIVSQS